jgi:glycosyltransferase involved in cell wall biosynthesis
MTTAALVIPAWNEPESIGAVLDEVPAGCVDDIIVVVRDVTDPTLPAARARGARTVVQARPGYGAACSAGAQAAAAGGAEILVFLDGDYSDPPAAVPRVLAPILAGRADLVLGCRDLRRFSHALPVHARTGNWLVRILVLFLVHHNFADLPSFKAIRVAALSRLDMRETTYGWTVEMLVKGALAGLTIEEIAVEYRPRLGGRSKVAGSVRGSLGAAWKLLGCVLAYASWRPDPAARALSIASGQ